MFPVHFSEFDRGQTIPPVASEAIWNFFAPFERLDMQDFVLQGHVVEDVRVAHSDEQ